MDPRAAVALDYLKAQSSPAHRDSLVRFGIVAKNPLGVPMAKIQLLAKQLGRDHNLAAELWATDVYEARLLAAYVDDPARVTISQMNRWRRDFDNWGITDTLCFVLFDKTHDAWSRVEKWASLKDEFGKRAAFALLASLALHDKKCPDETFLASLPLIEAAATDGRNFVKKGVNWALRSMVRRGPAVVAAAENLAQRLAESADPVSRWIGKDALRDFAKANLRAAKRRKGK